MSRLKIRELTTEDQDKFTAMIEKLGDKFDIDWIRKIYVEASQSKKTGNDQITDDILNVGKEIISLVYKTFKEDMRALFASLVNLTPEEYKKTLFGTDTNIMKQIKEAPEFRDFLEDVSCLYSPIKEYLKNLQAREEKSDSTTE